MCNNNLHNNNTKKHFSAKINLTFEIYRIFLLFLGVKGPNDCDSLYTQTFYYITPLLFTHTKTNGVLHLLIKDRI